LTESQPADEKKHARRALESFLPLHSTAVITSTSSALPAVSSVGVLGFGAGSGRGMGVRLVVWGMFCMCGPED
jgi:hypothetical protein